MRHLKSLRTLSLIIAAGLTTYIISCNADDKKEQEEVKGETKTLSKDEMIKRGDYLVTTGSCNDCHSPKVFGPHGEPSPDSSKLLSGHPASGQNPSMDANAGKPGG